MTEPIPFDRWLSSSPLSLPGKVILHRSTLSARLVAEIRSRGTWHPPASGNLNEAALLEVGGEAVAEGKVVQTKDGPVFQVVQVLGNVNGEKS